MDEEADDLYENTDFANTGLSAVALYDYQVNHRPREGGLALLLGQVCTKKHV